MKIEKVCTGYVAENCFLVLKNDTLHIIDPGADASEIIACIEKNFPQFKNVEILLTHAHADHIGAAGALAARFQVSAVHLAKADEEIYHSKENAFLPWIPLAENLPPTVPYAENENYRAIECPGHTPGGVSLLFEDGSTKHLFSGDTLFAGSIGRTDFPGGSMTTLQKTLSMLAASLDDDTIVYPGHGEYTTIGREKRTNVYFK